MGVNRKAYPLEYRERMVELVRSGRSPEELAREFEPCSESIRRWVVQVEIDEGRREGLTSEELVRLRRDVRRLREEREILKRAAAWFVRETESSVKRRSSS